MSPALADNVTEKVAEDIKARNKALIEDVLKVYPDKTSTRLAGQLGVYWEVKPNCGVKKLAKLMDRNHELFLQRKGIALQSEYPTDLIGNCIEAVSNVACSIRTQGEK